MFRSCSPASCVVSDSLLLPTPPGNCKLPQPHVVQSSAEATLAERDLPPTRMCRKTRATATLAATFSAVKPVRKQSTHHFFTASGSFELSM